MTTRSLTLEVENSEGEAVVGGDVPSWIQSKKIAFSNLHNICCEFDLIFPGKLGFSCDHVEKVFSKSCRDKHIQGIRGISLNSRGAVYPRISPLG
jgi:hypothetical protein